MPAGVGTHSSARHGAPRGACQFSQPVAVLARLLLVTHSEHNDQVPVAKKFARQPLAGVIVLARTEARKPGQPLPWIDEGAGCAIRFLKPAF
jgi:hypothetical protein